MFKRTAFNSFIACVTASLALISLSHTAMGVAPSFSAPQVVDNVPKVNTMVMGDFDGDGIPDVATLENSTGKVEVHFGDGAGGFRTAVADFTVTGSDASIRGMAAGDLNTDGTSELVFATGKAVAVYDWNGTAFTSVASIDLSASGIDATKVAIGDLSFQGSRDIVVSDDYGYHGVAWIPNDGTAAVGGSDWTFGTPQVFAAGGEGYYAKLTLVDVNGDGLDDVILTAAYSSQTDVSGQAGATCGVLLNNGDGTLAAEVYYGNPTLYALPGSSLSTSAVTVADVNGDGNPDLVSTCSVLDSSFNRTDYVSVNLGNGDGTYQEGQAFALSADSTDLVAADVTGTGQADILTCDYKDSGFTVTQLTGTGTGLTLAGQTQIPATGPFYNCIAVGYQKADGTLATFNNDAKIDVLLGTSSYVYDGNPTQHTEFAVLKNTTGSTGGGGGGLAPTTLTIDGTFTDGGAIDFDASQSSAVGGMIVRVQYSTTPDVEGSWTDLPDNNGGHLTLSGTAGVYTFGNGTTFYPAGTAVYFRAITSAPNYADSISNVLGPFTLHQASLSIAVSLISTSDTTGTLKVAHIGDDLTYTFSWQNTGDATAKNLRVQTTVPTYIDAASNLHVQFPQSAIDLKGNPYAHYIAAASGSSARIYWDTADLAPGYSQTVAFSVHLGSAVRLDQQVGLGNDYTVYSTTNQPPVPATGYTSGAPNVGATVRGPIKLTITPDVTQVAPGGFINYTITVRNEASYTAKNVVIADPVPEFSNLVPYDARTKLGTVFLNAKGHPADSPGLSIKVGTKLITLDNPLRLYGELPLAGMPAEVQAYLAANPLVTLPGGHADEVLFAIGSLAKGASVSVRLTVQAQYAPVSSITDGEIKNFDYESYFEDPQGNLVDTKNDSGNIFVPVQGAVQNAPNLALVKLVSQQTVSPGDAFTVAFAASNHGKSAADDVFIEDKLPAGVMLITQEKTPQALLPGTVPIVLPANAIGFVGKSASITASKANYYVTLDPDGQLHVWGLHLEPNDTVGLYYTVKVPASTPVPQTLTAGVSFIGAGNGNQSIVGSGTNRIFESEPTGLPEQTLVQVTGDIQLRTAAPGEAVTQPLISSDPAATRAQLDLIYKKNKNAAPIAGTQRYLIQYENAGQFTAGGVHLSFATPANTVFYRAEFTSNGLVVGAGTGRSIDPSTPAPLTSGTVTFNLGNLKGGTGGALMVEVINLPSAVSAGSSVITAETPHIYTGSVPQMVSQTKSNRRAYQPLDMTSTDSGGTIVYDGQNVPKVGVLKVVPQAVHPGDTFAIQFAIINYGDVDLSGTCDVQMQAPAGTQIVGVNADRGFVQTQSASALDVRFYPIAFGSHEANGLTVTLQVTGSAGMDITEDSIRATFPYIGTFQPGPTLIHIVEPSTLLGNTTITTVTGIQFATVGEMVIIPMGHQSDGTGEVLVSGPVTQFGDYNANTAFLVSDDGNGNRILSGADTGIPLLNVPVLNSTDTKAALEQLASVVGKHGGNIFNGPAANLMTPDGLVNNETGALLTTLKNMQKAGAQSVLPSGDVTYAPNGGPDIATVAGGVSHAIGGGYILTQGGGVISNDGASAISKDSGSLTSSAGASLISQDGSGLISQDGSGLISQDGSGLISQDGSGLVTSQASAGVVTTNAGNIVAAGGGNIVAAGGGNIVAAGGGNIAAQGAGD